MPVRYALPMLLCLLTGITVQAVETDSAFVRENYDKKEVRIEMRDGVSLHTVVYTPKAEGEYPIIMQRTPYSAGPYGEDKFRKMIGPNPFMMRDLYIVVYQDVRGRWMSDGSYTNMTPHVANGEGDNDTDESKDTYDTIEWLLANLEKNNGNVGQWGISYPGYYTAASLPEAHPALKAASPQAPISDFYFDDFHHHGAYFLSYWLATSLFGYQKEGPTEEAWYTMVRPETRDGYKFYMDMGALSNANEYYKEDNEFWQELVENPNYNEFWQKRNILPHLKDIAPATLVVGGWFDAEDLAGPLNIYKKIEKEDQDKKNNHIVMGPWSHGDWSRERGQQSVGNIYFGDSISTFYQKEIETPFFQYHLKGKGEMTLPEAHMYDTGLKSWHKFNTWPPKDAKQHSYFLGERGQFSDNGNAELAHEFISDPAKAVPYTEEVKIVFTPRPYMSGDQRFASRRPDVLVFETDILEQDITVAGEVLAALKVATDKEDADWVVKLIDVYPDEYTNHESTPAHIVLSGYQQMVRSEAIRGRYRNSFENPEPFVSGEKTAVDLKLQDVLHTFKKGHKIMIQVQSTWFPLIDRNPQKWVDNIFKASDDDFEKATHIVYGDSEIILGGEVRRPDNLSLPEHP